MALTEKYIKDGLTEEELNNYFLCYVEQIPKTYNDYDEDTKAMLESSEYKEYVEKRNNELGDEKYNSDSISDYNWFHDKDRKFSWNYWRYKDYPTPDYVEGYTHYLWFTNNMDKQWGDDWNDAPYDCNAGEPYYDDTEVIKIPVTINYIKVLDEYNSEEIFIKEELYNEWMKKYPHFQRFNLKMPDAYGYNTPFCIDDMKHRAVAWVFFTYSNNGHSYTKSAILMGGDSIQECINNIDKMNDIFEKYCIDDYEE